MAFRRTKDIEDMRTRDHIRAFRRRFYRRPVFWLAFVVVLVVIVRLALDPVATHYTRKALTEMEGYEGRFSDVSVGVVPPRYVIRDLLMIQEPGGRWSEPFLRVQEIDARLSGRALLRGKLAASIRIDRPKVTVIQREKADEEKKPFRLPDVAAALEDAPPLLVSRIEIKNGEILYRDMTQPHRPELWVHRMEVATENAATRPDLANGRPTTTTVRAVVQRSGELTSFLSANPFADSLTFAGRTQLRGLRLAELHDVFVDAADMKATKGTVDLFAEYRAENGVLSGGVKPVLKNVEIRAAGDDFGDRVKAWLADKTLDIFSDRVPERNAVATTIPIKGRIDSPDVQLLPAVLGIVRNAFVEGLISGFSNLPPDTAEQKEGPLKQVKDALTGSEPPQAQPGPEEGNKAQPDKRADRAEGKRP